MANPTRNRQEVSKSKDLSSPSTTDSDDETLVFDDPPEYAANIALETADGPVAATVRGMDTHAPSQLFEAHGSQTMDLWT